MDVLKVAGEGATRLVGSVLDTPVEQLASSTAIAAHRRLLTKSGLSDVCRACDVVDVCGGGSVPHRHRAGGFDNPTVYCGEMKALIRHVRTRLTETFVAAEPLADELPDFDLDAFELAEASAGIVARLHSDAIDEDAAGLAEALAVLEMVGEASALEPSDLRTLARHAGTVAWHRALLASLAGRAVHDVDGRPIPIDAEYARVAIGRLGRDNLEIGEQDDWLRKPFGETIDFEDEATAAKGLSLIHI